MRTDKILDKIARLVYKEKQEEVDRLKQQIQSIKKEGKELCFKYSFMSNPDSEIDLYSDAHDLFDFLQGM